MKHKELEFVGKVFYGSDGCLTDRFLIWISKKRQSEKMWGKQCEVIIKLKEKLQNGGKE